MLAHWRSHREPVGWPLITQYAVPALYDYLRPFYSVRRYRHYRQIEAEGHYPAQLRRSQGVRKQQERRGHHHQELVLDHVHGEEPGGSMISIILTVPHRGKSVKPSTTYPAAWGCENPSAAAPNLVNLFPLT